MSNDLFDDIAEESLVDALQNGNLRGEKSRADKAKVNPWTGTSAWTSEGYHCQVHIFSCHCGVQVRRLHGVFHSEKAPSGSIRMQMMDMRTFQLPLGQKHETRFAHFKTHACISCVGAYGFSPDAIVQE